MEIDYDELFNIETGADIAESTADEAQDTAQETQETEAGQEAAKEENPENGQETAENEQETREAKDKKPEQTPEERARQAEGRRRREAEEAGRKAGREAAEAEFTAILERMQIPDPDTGEAVDSYDKFKAYDEKLSKSRLQKGRPTEWDIRRVVREEQQRAEQEEQPPEPTEDPRIRQELDAIRQLDPEMTDLGAILQSEAGERFKGYVRKGLGFLDAYKLAAEDRLTRLRSASAEAAARVKAASKDHLSATGTRGTGAVTVPRDIEQEYKKFFPDATQAEIQKMYAADQKKYGKK